MLIIIFIILVLIFAGAPERGVCTNVRHVDSWDHDNWCQNNH